MDILQDIKNILIKNKDKAHNLKIEASSLGVMVYLCCDYGYDYSQDRKEDFTIPIYFDNVEQFAYIPNKEYREKYSEEDLFGIDLQEITLIKEIMEYLEAHSNDINKLCYGFCWDDRECIEDNKINTNKN